MRCSVKTCQSKSGPGSGIHFFQFPLRDKKRLDKWIAAVGKPNWRPIKTSRICSLHFNEIDIIRNVGYQRVYLRENAVPKNCFLIDVDEKEQTDVETSKLKEMCNVENINEVVDSSKTSILNRYVIHEHNYSHNISLRIGSAGPSIFSTQEPCESIEKKILNQDKKHEFIHGIPATFSHTSTISTNSGDENDLANMGKIVKKLSKNVQLLRRQNKTLKQKLRRHKRRIDSMKQMFDRL